MKFKLILEDSNEIDLLLKQNSKLELELSQANVFQTGSSSYIENTDYLPEGEVNKYHTDDRVRLIVSNMLPEPPRTTDDIEEGTNLYFTDQRARTALQEPLNSKLDKIDFVQHFKGLFPSYSSLITNIPTSSDGDYAHIDSGGGFDRMVAIWDSSDNKWIVKDVNVPSITDEIAEGQTNLYFNSERVLSIVNPLLTPIQNQIGEIDLLLSQVLGV